MSSTLSSVRNALQILHLLRQRGPLRVSEIAAAMGIGVSTAHRLLATLRDERFVRQQAAGRRYELGQAMLLTSGTTAIEHCVLVSAPTMEQLQRRTGETVHLSVLRGTQCVFAASVESDRPVRVTSRIGQHPPAHSAAAGKVLLSRIDDDRLGELYPDAVLPAVTQRSVRTMRELREELTAVRAGGYARNIGESESDMYAIAVAIRRPGGEVVTSLSIAAPLSRVDVGDHGEGLSVQEQEYLLELRAAAQQIEDHLAF